MRAPLIGICTALEQAKWGVWDQPAMLLPRNYIDTIQKAGGVALMLPPDGAVIAEPDLVLDVIDGLILAGGADLDPSSYGAERDPRTMHTVPERDDFELALARRAIERDIPFLGICRGMQVMNVAQGGTLIQDLPTALGHDEHCRVPGSFNGADHPVHMLAGSQAAKASGGEHAGTLSHHHQGIAELGEDLVVSGWSDIDELPEAIEVPDRRFALGVQWHPEADVTSQVIATLVVEAREYALARAA
ncbi:MAG TPA: gamma-glutamyl-gamma-aminobutyrate hydrolase family protein [Solirubrobacteraceae bacterium]|jgi:putative glutamine amidotransferase